MSLSDQIAFEKEYGWNTEPIPKYIELFNCTGLHGQFDCDLILKQKELAFAKLVVYAQHLESKLPDKFKYSYNAD